jgi:putative phosphoesterase
LKIGLISDAHGNHLGLEACLTFFTDLRVARTYFLGDAVGYLPDPRRVTEILMSRDVRCLLGNHDAMLLGALSIREHDDSVYRIEESRKTLSAKTRDRLASLSPSYAFSTGGKRVLLVHGSPWDPLQGYVYPDSDLRDFRHLPYDYVFMGNTHRPFVRKRGGMTLVNVGSCGLPRDRGDLASCAVFDTGSGDCTVYRIRFDPRLLLAQYRDAIHTSVLECFARRPRSRVFGELVEGRQR